MIYLLRLTASLLLVGVLTAGCFLIQPAWMSESGLDVWAMPELLRVLHQEECRGAELALKDERLQHSIQVKDKTAADLLAGRITLVAAAERFREAAAESLPLLCRQLRFQFPRASDDELLYLHVINWTQQCLEHEPQRCRQLTTSLQREMGAALQTGAQRSNQ